MTFDVSRATNYIADLDLSNTPRGLVDQGAAEEASQVFTDAKAQAQVVGSALFTFATGVTAETRSAISSSALLAQLVANKKADFGTSPLEWYAAYVEVLQNVGWVVQDQGWSDVTADGTASEVHQEIIALLAVALGPAATALAIVESAIGVLAKMAPDTSWLTIFDRETKRASMARFQVGLVEQEEDAQVRVALLGCLIQARSSITQVLFFKFRSEHASFKSNSGTVTIDEASLRELMPAIRGKVRAYQSDYLSSIQDV